MTAQPQPGWRDVRVLTGTGLTGQRVDILTGVVRTHEGLRPALMVGVSGIVADMLLVADLMANLQQATESARTGAGEEC